MSKLQLDGWRYVAGTSLEAAVRGHVQVVVSQNGNTFRAAIRDGAYGAETVSARDSTARGALGIAKVRALAAGLGGLHLEAAISEIEDQLGLASSVTEEGAT